MKIPMKAVAVVLTELFLFSQLTVVSSLTVIPANAGIQHFQNLRRGSIKSKAEKIVQGIRENVLREKAEELGGRYDEEAGKAAEMRTRFEGFQILLNDISGELAEVFLEGEGATDYIDSIKSDFLSDGDFSKRLHGLKLLQALGTKEAMKAALEWIRGNVIRTSSTEWIQEWTILVNWLEQKEGVEVFMSAARDIIAEKSKKTSDYKGLFGVYLFDLIYWTVYWAGNKDLEDRKIIVKDGVHIFSRENLEESRVKLFLDADYYNDKFFYRIIRALMKNKEIAGELKKTVLRFKVEDSKRAGFWQKSTFSLMMGKLDKNVVRYMVAYSREWEKPMDENKQMDMIGIMNDAADIEIVRKEALNQHLGVLGEIRSNDRLIYYALLSLRGDKEVINTFFKYYNQQNPFAADVYKFWKKFGYSAEELGSMIADLDKQIAEIDGDIEVLDGVTAGLDKAKLDEVQGADEELVRGINQDYQKRIAEELEKQEAVKTKLYEKRYGLNEEREKLMDTVESVNRMNGAVAEISREDSRRWLKEYNWWSDAVLSAEKDTELRFKLKFLTMEAAEEVIEIAWGWLMNDSYRYRAGIAIAFDYLTEENPEALKTFFTGKAFNKEEIRKFISEPRPQNNAWWNKILKVMGEYLFASHPYLILEARLEDETGGKKSLISLTTNISFNLTWLKAIKRDAEFMDKVREPLKQKIAQLKKEEKRLKNWNKKVEVNGVRYELNKTGVRELGSSI